MQQIDARENVTCTWCEESFDVRPISSAKGFTCPECGRDSSLGQLRNPDLRPYALAISKEAAIASTANLHRHAAAYVFISKDGSEDFASGTCVQIGDRHFLATIAHAVPKEVESIGLVKKAPAIFTRAPEQFARVVRRVPSGDLDVAAFELQTEAVARVGLEPIGIDRIHDGGAGNPNFKARLIGYPAAYRVHNYPRSGIRGFYALCYGCEPIEPERWVAIPPNNVGLDKDIHVVVDFTYDTVSWGEEGLPIPEGMPDPWGLSGGGLWQRTKRVKDDELWTPDDLRLFAIQSGWLKQAGFLIAIQIIHWLKLVADEYPELCGELQDRFPRLKQIV